MRIMRTKEKSKREHQKYQNCNLLYGRKDKANQRAQTGAGIVQHLKDLNNI